MKSGDPSAGRSRTARMMLFAAAALALALAADWIARPRPGLEARYHFEFKEAAAGDPSLIRREAAPTSERFAEFQGKPGRMRVVYAGAVRIRRPGVYHFFVGTKEGQSAWLTLDGAPLAGTNAGPEYPWRGIANLKEGLHPIRLEYRDLSLEDPSNRIVSLMWSRELDPLRVEPQPIPEKLVFGPEARPWRFAVSAGLRALAAGLALWIALLAPGLLLSARRLRLLRFSLAAVAMSFCMCLVAMEIGLRLLGYHPRKYVPGDIWVTYKFPKPNTVTRYKGYLPYHVQEFETEVRMNSAGWRDREYAREKPEGVRRVLVIGDSYVEGKEVELDRTFHKRLEEALNRELGPETGARYEVPALGKGGSSTIAHFDFLTSPGLAMKPDIVALSFFPGNDVRENNVELNDEYQKWLDEVYRSWIMPARVAVIERLTVLPWSRLNHFVVDRFSDFYVGRLYWFKRGLDQRRMVSNDLDVYRNVKADARWEAGWRTSEEYMLKMRDAARAAGAEFIVMFVFSAQLPGYDSEKLMLGGENGIDLRRPFERAEEICKRNGIQYVNLQPILTEHERRTGEKYYWRYDAHWNEVGHSLAAEALLKEIKDMERQKRHPARAVEDREHEK